MTISVCIATYNGEKYVRGLIASILSQETPVDEIIVSDDGSTDHTIAILREMGDARIRIFAHKASHSPIFNFENALSHAAGDHIFLADQDDLWHPAKVSRITPLLQEYDLVVSDCSLIDENDGCIVPSYFEQRGSGPGIGKNIWKNTYLGCCMAFRRSVLLKALPFPPSIPMHDMWLGLIAEIYGSTHFCNEKLVSFRRHASNASPTAALNSSYSLVQKIRFRFDLVSALMGRYWERTG